LPEARAQGGPGTALVTGASSGIGEQFARQLAARGHDLVLVARRADRLERLAAELPAEARVVPCDLAADAVSLPARVADLGVDVELLVNNAGFGTSGPFLDHDPKRDAEQVRLNCEAIVTLSHAFLPGMVERRRGGVINVASSAGLQPIPYESVYAATKAFVISFTDALHIELRGSGVRVLAVNPGPVPTEWQEKAGYESGRPPAVPGAISAEQVVREALAAYDRGRRSVIPGRAIRWFIRATRPSPRAIQLRVTERMYRPR
jgi:short-subunit dehydrogenase